MLLGLDVNFPRIPATKRAYVCVIQWGTIARQVALSHASMSLVVRYSSQPSFENCDAPSLAMPLIGDLDRGGVGSKRSERWRGRRLAPKVVP